MTQAVVIGDFLKLLEKSKLMNAAQIRKLVKKFDLKSKTTAREVAQLLVTERILTPYQGERLLEGRYRGFIIDRYRIREVLGAGGMGCIYIAEDTRAKKKVAIKVMSAEHQVDSGMLTRMRLEATAGMKLDHPNIVKTYRFDQTGAVTFMIMELVRGVSLHELIAMHGALPYRMACDMMMQMACGLHAAHQQGIVHRDIKPANFLVQNDGTVKVLDFGLALLADNADDEFSLKMIFGHDCLGTPDFIAPEQVIDSGKVDATADIYGLGCTLYLMLCGQLPFPLKTIDQKLEAQRTKKPKSLAKLAPTVPPEVIAIVERMMKKQSNQRFPSCVELMEALKPFAKRTPIDFEFRSILSIRASQARKRQAKSDKKRKTGHSSIGGASTWSASSSKALQNTETRLVNEDTRPIVNIGDSGKHITRPGSSADFQPDTPLPPTRSTRVAAKTWLHRLNDSSGSKTPLTTSPFTIGRDSSCNLCIDKSNVSGKHCELRLEGDAWVIKDLNSRNGIMVNGSPSAGQILLPNDKITIGQDYHFQITDSSELKPKSDAVFYAAVAGAVIAVIGFLFLLWKIVS